MDGRQPRDGDAAAAWYSYENTYGIAPPSSVSSFVTHYGVYKWYPESVARAKHTAEWFADRTGSSGEYNDIEEIFEAIATMYVGGSNTTFYNETLTEAEMAFIESAMSRSSTTRYKAVAALMNARTMTGWTTHGHSSADCSVHAFGPGEDRFYGQWQNWELGLLMSEIFGVEEERQEEQELMEELFINGELKICDPTVKPSSVYVEWQENVTYPPGNILEGQYCIEEWEV